MEKIDYKKRDKQLYQPKTEPSVITVPSMLFILVDGKGDPNTSPAYKRAIELLYGLSYGIKMSKMGGDLPEGYFEYVVPPLEGLWWTEEEPFEIGLADKSKFCWSAMIRQPEFVTENVFQQAKEKLQKKKPDLEVSAARLQVYEEGLCCQIMHRGSYDSEGQTMERIRLFLEKNGYEPDRTRGRRHHEIYLSDPRKTAPENLRTIIRCPIRRKEGVTE